MNCYLKNELELLSKDDEEFIKDVINEIDIFEDMEKKETLNDFDKRMIDNTMESVNILLDEIYYLVHKDWYIKLRNLYRIIQILLSNEFKNNLNEYYDILNKYLDILDELDYFYDSYKKRSVEEVKVACELCYISYLNLLNDKKNGDYYLHNRKKYKESDILNVKYASNRKDMLYLTLKSENRKYRKGLN